MHIIGLEVLIKSQICLRNISIFLFQNMYEEKESVIQHQIEDQMDQKTRINTELKLKTDIMVIHFFQ